MIKAEKSSTYRDKLFNIMDVIVSVIVFLVAVRLLLYMITSLYSVAENMFVGGLWVENKTNEILHWIVYYIVMVKAYKVLVGFAKFHKVSLKEVTELVIVTSFIELIFQMQNLPIAKIAALGITGVATLLVYLYYYEKLVAMNSFIQSERDSDSE